MTLPAPHRDPDGEASFDPQPQDASPAQPDGQDDPPDTAPDDQYEPL